MCFAAAVRMPEAVELVVFRCSHGFAGEVGQPVVVADVLLVPGGFAKRRTAPPTWFSVLVPICNAGIALRDREHAQELLLEALERESRSRILASLLSVSRER